MAIVKKVLVVCSTGGHFDAALAVLPAFRGCRVEMVSYRAEVELRAYDPAAIGVGKVHLVAQWGNIIGIRLFLSFLVNFFQAFWILLRFRPAVVFSTGSEISIPVVVMARLLLIPRIVHLETATRPRKISPSGRILMPFCSEFFVQWPEAVALSGGKARFAGRVF
jgi:beta-1,4-N-acetylglucosaminyltransferase